MSYEGCKEAGSITVVAVGLVDLGHLSCHLSCHRHRLGTLVAPDELCGSNIDSAFRCFREAQLLKTRRTRTCSNSESSMFALFQI